MVLLGERFSEVVIGRVNPRRTSMKVINQRFQRRKLADTAFPLTLDGVELFVLHRISTQCGVLDHGHGWRAGNEFAGLIVFG